MCTYLPCTILLPASMKMVIEPNVEEYSWTNNSEALSQVYKRDELPRMIDLRDSINSVVDRQVSAPVGSLWG